MRVLVTGASGFVGGHLIRRLAAEHQVIAVTRRAVAVPGADEVRIVPAIDSTTDWSGLLDDVDVVVHLAARVHVMNETAENPPEAFREVNLRGTERLARSCAAQGVKRFVFMSTIKVNGEATHGRAFSSRDVSAPDDPYGRSKWEAEQALRDLSASKGLEVVVLRPTVIYGTGVKGNIARIVRALQMRLPLPLASIHNRRTLLSVENLSHWVARAVEAPQIPSGPVLIGDPHPVSTAQLVACVARGLGIRSMAFPFPAPLLERLARLLRRDAMVRRLTGDLEVEPTFDAFPGIRDELADSLVALTEFGCAERDGLRSSRPRRRVSRSSLEDSPSCVS